MESEYGYFGDNDAFIVTNPRTQRAFDNFLWNDAAFACVQQTGVGYFDYQVDGQEATKLMTGEGRICDFDIFGRDAMMSRLIYVRDDDSGVFWNLNWEPVCADYQEYRCEHGVGYTRIENMTQDVRGSFRLFVPPGDDPVEVWTVGLANASERPRNLSIFFYNQISFGYKWGFNSYGDMIFRGADFHQQKNAVVATKHPHVSPHPYQTGFLTSERDFVSYDGTRDAFVGMYNNLQRPEALLRGHCSNTPGSSDSTILAAQLKLTLEPGEQTTFDCLLGVTDSVDGIDALKTKYLGRSEEHFDATMASRRHLLDTESVQSPDTHLNRMVNVWTKHQTHFGATWCRWGWMGYRDVVQHGLGVCSFDSSRTRRIIVEALRYQYKNGLAIRGWNPIDEKPYSDSALWLIFTVTAYLKETGDFALMDQRVSYYDGGEGSVWQHFDAVLDFLEENKGQHELCLIKYGDWNDSLTGVGRQGRGESVWLSMAYARALLEVVELHNHLGDQEKAARYLARYEKMKMAINTHAWDGAWYVRCFDDAGEAIGSSQSAQGRIFVNAQSWALISGVADKERAGQVLESCDEQLMTDLGYLLLHPTFEEPDDRIGRISYLEPGICENGTIYAHVNAWMFLALLLERKPDQAYDLFRRITPGYSAGQGGWKEKSPPYVYANCYFGPKHRNRAYQMEFTWMTGSVAWFYQVMMQHMIGVRAEYDGLRIDPQLPSAWTRLSVNKTIRGASYTIKINRDAATTETTIHVDGKAIAGNLIPYGNMGDRFEVEVCLPPAPCGQAELV